ncbi:MAG: hypothetical protein ABJC63_14025, partial [Gemmatimonadales bacterium]
AHASAGMWATAIGGRNLVTLLWELSAVGFIAAGAGVLGVSELRKRWRTFAVVAALASLLLLGIFGHPLFLAGIVADVILLVIAVLSWRNTPSIEPSPIMPRTMQRILLAFMLYVAILIGLRPWYSSWGSTASEQQMVLIGDPPLGASHYRIDHAITINAPVDSVWPLVLQLGEDKSSLYSRDWHVTQIEPGRAIVLRDRGAIVLDPIDSRTTRMHVRTMGPGIPTLPGIGVSAISFLTIEPVHFVIERAMLRGLKQRAEARP